MTRFKADARAREALAHTLRLGDVSSEEFDTVSTAQTLLTQLKADMVAV